MNTAIAQQRLHNQHITRNEFGEPADLVEWLGAVQAQDFPAAKWALALRMQNGAAQEDIERAFDNGSILRTHVMRPTWHFVNPLDICWMLDLTASRVQQALAHAYREFELDLSDRIRAADVFADAVRDGQYRTRAELGALVARVGLVAKGVRLALLTVYAELEGVLCSGPRRGKDLTYTQLSSRAPRARRLSRDEAIAELSRRYFRSHGPATIRDFVWWSGLTTSDAKRGLEINKARQKFIDGRTYWTVDDVDLPRSRAAAYLLPIYDEYLVAYRDLDAVPRKAGTRGILQQALVIAGQVRGTWKVTKAKDRFVVEVTSERPLSQSESRALNRVVSRYGKFLEKPISLDLQSTQ